MAQSSAYMRTARYHNPEKFWLCIIPEKGFLYGLRCQHHFRLIAIAVVKESQGTGVATCLLQKLYELCDKYDLGQITFRTHKHGSAINFWKKNGAAIIGEKGEDYEMKIVL